MYAAGGFDFPASTGNYSVTGVGFQPVAVLMFGSNFATVGSLMTSQAGPGLFFSVNALDYSNGTTIRSLCLSLNGANGGANYRGYENGCISMQTNAAGAGTVDYRASTITFDADGFTINVTTGASARRPIHWLAFGGDLGPTEATAMVSSAVKQVMSGAPTFNNAYEPKSALVISTVASNGFGEDYVDGNCWYSFGTGHYPKVGAGNPNDWHSSTIYTQVQTGSPIGRQGFTAEYVWDTASSNPSALNVSSTIGALGPVLNEGYRRHRPNISTNWTQMVNEGTTGSTPWQYALWWNGEGWTDFAFVSDGSTTTVPRPANFEVFDAVLFSHVNGNASGGGAVEMRFGFGLLHADYQGCAVIGADGSCYQAVGDRCVAECTASGADTASGVLNTRNFVLTAQEGGDVGQIVWHGFGHQAPLIPWWPHIYRRVLLTSDAGATTDFPSVTHTRGPGGTPPLGAGLIGAGTSQSIHAETGFGATGLVGSGAKAGAFTFVRSGSAAAGLVGSGADAATLNKTGFGKAGTVGSGFLPTTGYLLLEDGTSKIILEETGGFLLL